LFFFRVTDTVPIGHFLALPLKPYMSFVVVYNLDLIKVIVVVVGV